MQNEALRLALVKWARVNVCLIQNFQGTNGKSNRFVAFTNIEILQFRFILGRRGECMKCRSLRVKCARFPLNKKDFQDLYICALTWKLSESKMSASPHTCFPGGWGACWIWEPCPTLHQKLSRDREARWWTFCDSGPSVSSMMSRRCCSSTDTGRKICKLTGRNSTVPWFWLRMK